MNLNLNQIFKFFAPFLITFFIFLIIQQLIMRSGEISSANKNPNLLEFIRIKENDNLQQRQRTLPDKPPKPERPPQPELNLDPNKPPPINNFDFDIPDFSIPTDFKGAFLGEISSLTSGTSQLIPIVKVTPICPREAAIAGINGSVLMLLNVNASGKVDRVVIKQAKPPSIFNNEASRAVRRWQFKPKTIDGVAVDQEGELLVEFVCNV
ncbi:MAG: energy transducer TonB [Candidatus Marinimicrobia bacterium]|nr:energy transducer TonB [Candidatus Neomarinimicrobiota bacterium]